VGQYTGPSSSKEGPKENLRWPLQNSTRWAGLPWSYLPAHTVGLCPRKSERRREKGDSSQKKGGLRK